MSWHAVAVLLDELSLLHFTTLIYWCIIYFIITTVLLLTAEKLSVS